MAVVRGLPKDWLLKLESFDYRTRTEVESADKVLGSFRVTRTEGFDHHGYGLSLSDGISDLDLGATGETGNNDLSGDEATEVCAAAVDLGGVLSAEGSAPVTSGAAVGVHDDFAAGHAAVG